MIKINISKIEDLNNFVKELSSEFGGGEILGLVGELGAGKTTFTQLLAKELGVKTEVKSPTFVLVREYLTGSEVAKKGIKLLVHADAYRLETEDEIWGIGFDELAGRSDTITIVEWADRVPSLQTFPNYIELNFKFGKLNERWIEWDGFLNN